MDKRPTIIDVATLAGVSKSTVSLVLQQSPLVKAETREDVRRAMAQLGYVYNRAAANLRSANAGLIGVVINDLRNPFFTEFATNAQMTFASHSYPEFHLLMPLFACRKWSGIVAGREGQQLAWVRPENLRDYPMPPADLPLIPILRDWL